MIKVSLPTSNVPKRLKDPCSDGTWPLRELLPKDIHVNNDAQLQKYDVNHLEL